MSTYRVTATCEVEADSEELADLNVNGCLENMFSNVEVDDVTLLDEGEE